MPIKLNTHITFQLSTLNFLDHFQQKNAQKDPNSINRCTRQGVLPKQTRDHLNATNNPMSHQGTQWDCETDDGIHSWAVGLTTKGPGAALCSEGAELGPSTRGSRHQKCEYPWGQVTRG